jgi:hypothetical protein
VVDGGMHACSWLVFCSFVGSINHANPSRARGGHHGPLPELCVAAKLQAGAANTSNQVWVYCVTVTYHTASCCLIDQMLAPVLLCPAVRRTITSLPLSSHLSNFHSCACMELLPVQCSTTRVEFGPVRGNSWTDRTRSPSSS